MEDVWMRSDLTAALLGLRRPLGVPGGGSDRPPGFRDAGQAAR
jgi:hypothetical protein